MTISTIILSHYKEREKNLKRIIDDLMEGTVKPEKIIVFIDNPAIKFEDERVTIIRSSKPFLPIIRFALGTVCDTDYCFFLDDDLSVRKKTLENFLAYENEEYFGILGLEGSILGNTDTPYTNDTPVKRGVYANPVPVDIIIRTYFVPIAYLIGGLNLRIMLPGFPKRSVDDIFLCLGNKYFNKVNSYVIPVNEETDVTELPDGGVGQSLTDDHYKIRNEVSKALRDVINTRT